jgi:class 3 adenylate cyclase
VLPGVVIAITCMLAFEFLGPLRIARDWIADLRLATLTPDVAPSEEIIVLAITEQTLARFPFRAPIDRGFLADLVEQLGANTTIRALGIDLLFDQPTIASDDERLRLALHSAPFPVVVATGDEEVGLTQQQAAYQAEYLDGITTGSAVLRSQDGVVRNYWPYAGDQKPGFAMALGQAAGLDPPPTSVPVLFRRASADGLPPIRTFEADTVALLPQDWLSDKIILLGSILPHQDQHRTFLSVLGGNDETTPGVMIYGQMLRQMLTGDAPPPVRLWVLLLMVFLACVAGRGMALLPAQVPLRVLFGIAIVPLYWLAAFTGFIFWHLPLPVLEPVTAYILTVAYTVMQDRRRQQRQKRFMHDALLHYVAKPVVDDLLAHPEKLRLGGENRDMSFLFTDVAGFSTLTESLHPEDLVGLMMSYFEGLMEVALKWGGTIGRLSGDGLLVFFGAPQEQNDHACRAVDCALAIDRFCEEFRVQQALRSLDFGETRIGVHSGTAIVGNVGGSHRFEYTAYGDVINIASRLESLNRHLGTRVCISGASLIRYPADRFRPVGEVILKGQAHALDVFTIWDKLEEAQRIACRVVFDKMVRSDSRAHEALEQLADMLREDPLTLFQLRQISVGLSPVSISMAEK